jgi:hypothetical protein
MTDHIRRRGASMTEAQLWIEKAEKWRTQAQTARDFWTVKQLLWLAAQAEMIALEDDQSLKAGGTESSS